MQPRHCRLFSTLNHWYGNISCSVTYFLKVKHAHELHLLRYLLQQTLFRRRCRRRWFPKHPFSFSDEDFHLLPSGWKQLFMKNTSVSRMTSFHQRLSNEICQRVMPPVGIWQQREDHPGSCVFSDTHIHWMPNCLMAAGDGDLEREVITDQ